MARPQAHVNTSQDTTVLNQLSKWKSKRKLRPEKPSLKGFCTRSIQEFPEMVFKKVVVLMMSCLGLSRQQAHPVDLESETGECSSVDEQQCFDSSKIWLSDGRSLAYRERGVSKNESIYRVIIVHGFASSKEMDLMASDELLDEMSIYLLFYDRAGYGESDPNPKRSLKSEASDIEELADKLQLGPKFYVLGVSIGCYPAWSCLKQIPDRLAGTVLVAPYINYRWGSLPGELIRDDYRKGLSRWSFLVARYIPGLLHWWMTQKMFPSSTVIDRNPTFFCTKDLEVLKNTPGYQLLSKNKLRKREVFDSMRHDFIVAFDDWDFDPLELNDPYPDKDGSVHIWQGHEDKVVPFQLQRCVSERLPWIRYHEVPDGGHFLVYDNAVCEAILRSLLLGEDPSLYIPVLD